MSTAERFLRVLLRINGVVAGTAAVAVFMPRSWMDAVHQWLGLGPLPGGPIFEYMARSLSALYALIGGFAWRISGDVRRHEGLIRYYAMGFIAFGLVMLPTDFRIGMPMFWTANEGPWVIAVGGVILALQARIRSEAAAQ